MWLDMTSPMSKVSGFILLEGSWLLNELRVIPIFLPIVPQFDSILKYCAEGRTFIGKKSILNLYYIF